MITIRTAKEDLYDDSEILIIERGNQRLEKEDLIGIRKVIVKDGITDLNIQGFGLCQAENLEEVVLPQSLERIGAYVFKDCHNLSRINSDIDGEFNIPDSVTDIGPRQFCCCFNLLKISLNVPVLEGTFQQCENLCEVILGDKIRVISDSCFWYCQSLFKITLPEGLERIRDGSFMCCNSLRRIEIPDSVQVLGEELFNKCENLEKATLPSKRYTERELAHLFDGCNSLQTVYIDAPRKEIGVKQFSLGRRIIPVIAEDGELPFTVKTMTSSARERDRFAFRKSTVKDFYSIAYHEDKVLSYDDVQDIRDALSDYMLYNVCDGEAADGSTLSGGACQMSKNYPGSDDTFDKWTGKNKVELWFRFFAIDFSESGRNCIIEQVEDLLTNFPIRNWIRSDMAIYLAIYSKDTKNSYCYKYELGTGFLDYTRD